MLIKSKNKNISMIRNQKGFSLLEILIALTLLIGAGVFVAGNVLDSLYEGQVDSAKIQMNAFSARLKEYKRHCYRYPTTEQGLEALIEKPTSGPECKRYNPNGYIADGTLPDDPWGTPYFYESDGRKYNIISYGVDGMEGGEEQDKDIYLFEKKE